MAFELGLYTFGDLMPDVQDGNAVGARQRLSEILEAAKLADAAGLDLFAVGEHHRLDMAVSATTVVLAAIAAVTSASGWRARSPSSARRIRSWYSRILPPST